MSLHMFSAHGRAATAWDAVSSRASDWQDVLENPGHAHIAYLHGEARELAKATARFAGAGLRAGESVVVLARLAHWHAVQARLAQDGLDPDEAIKRGNLVFCGAHDIAQRWKASEQLPRVLGPILARARIRHRGLRVYSELSQVLRGKSPPRTLLLLEQALGELAAGEGCPIMCDCRLDRAADGYCAELGDMRGTHSHLVPDRTSLWFDEVVRGAICELLEPAKVRMVLDLVDADGPPVTMPPGQAALLWLERNMPLTAVKVLARARAAAPHITSDSS